MYSNCPAIHVYDSGLYIWSSKVPAPPKRAMHVCLGFRPIDMKRAVNQFVRGGDKDEIVSPSISRNLRSSV